RSFAKRLDLLLTLRKLLPGQDPFAEIQAPLARARILLSAQPAGLPLRPQTLGLGGAAPGALSRSRGRREPTARLGRPASRPLPQPAVRGGLDRGARPAGAARPQLPEPEGRASTPGRQSPMSTPRDDILGGIRRALRRGAASPDAGAEIHERVGAHRRNLVPARAAALGRKGRIESFLAMPWRARTTVARVASQTDIPAEV